MHTVPLLITAVLPLTLNPGRYQSSLPSKNYSPHTVPLLITAVLPLTLNPGRCHTDKKKIKFFSYVRKFRVEQSQSHMWGRVSLYMRKCANISPYMRRPLVIYDFATAPYWISLYMKKIWFSFYQCSHHCHIRNVPPCRVTSFFHRLKTVLQKIPQNAAVR
jgi:hypothetical protein